MLIFLDDIRLWTDWILAEIDRVRAGRDELSEWSGNQSFATIEYENALLEAQWIMDASGKTELYETLPTALLRSLVEEWGEILRRHGPNSKDQSKE